MSEQVNAIGEDSSAKEILTIFIPSYNRREKLRIALDSVFEALAKSIFSHQVKVLVVDDYSSENIEEVIYEHKSKGNDLTYRLQRQKCGVAEIAMLSCLEYIDTKFAWCLGNDDMLMTDSINFLLPILEKTRSSFLLLNLTGRNRDLSEYEYFVCNDKEIIFDKGEQLFANFGFANATTTLSCLCFEVEPLRRIDCRRFWSISPIYSQTISFFAAFHLLQCSFIARPLVIVSHNEQQEEQEKLENGNRLFGFPSFYHSSLGLVRQIRRLAETFSLRIEDMVAFREDVLDKNTKQVRTMTTGAFVLHSCVIQLDYEIWSTVEMRRNIIYFRYQDIDELQSFFHETGVYELEYLFSHAMRIYCSEKFSTQEKRRLLATIMKEGFVFAQEQIKRSEKESENLGYLHLPFGASKKIVKLMIRKREDLFLHERSKIEEEMETMRRHERWREVLIRYERSKLEGQMQTLREQLGRERSRLEGQVQMLHGQLENDRKELEGQVRALRGQLDEERKELEDQMQALRGQLDEERNRLEVQTQALGGQLRKAKANEQELGLELSKIYQSTAWKLVRLIRKIWVLLAPPGSRRERL